MPELLARASSRTDWKRISAESSLMSPRQLMQLCYLYLRLWISVFIIVLKARQICQSAYVLISLLLRKKVQSINLPPKIIAQCTTLGVYDRFCFKLLSQFHPIFLTHNTHTRADKRGGGGSKTYPLLFLPLDPTLKYPHSNEWILKSLANL